ncbi:MAG TPA: phosphoenolpyruvate--protein phosphotransferase [bacterium]|nr:phosphoenolpyruvate--protein phosphotransferase [bacterium]HNT64191.1 phosphoenolpyruvate--protein phosphotransferase [bacterium]
MEPSSSNKEIRIKGIPASPGIAIGSVLVLSGDSIKVDSNSITPDQIDAQIAKLMQAIEKSKIDLIELREKAEQSFGETDAQIFDTHNLMLDDDLIIQEAIKRIRERLETADNAYFQAVSQFESYLAHTEDEYLRARTSDLVDIKRRVIRHIQGKPVFSFAMLENPVIVVAQELTPSDTVNFKRDKILASATELGGRTSHAAIMSRSLKVPSIVGLGSALQALETGDQVIVDGNKGWVIAHPSLQTIAIYEKQRREFAVYQAKLGHIRDLPAKTRDGKKIELSANIEFPEEAQTIGEDGANGVGLYRTEYLFLTRKELPSEEEQYREYARIVQIMGDQPIIIRTLDVGGDKLPTSIKIAPEDNPFLGVRGLRLYLPFVDVFKTQLRAILRASAKGQVRLLLPMITTVSEIKFCKEILAEVKEDLRRGQIPFEENLPVGATIEVPSAAIIADIIAAECDFLSIGTNDLIQYTLAVDRGNENLAYLYQAYNPAILRLIREVIEKGHQQTVWVGMCGEMASDPLATMVLIGLGLDEFSVSPISIPLIKEIIRRVDYTECEGLAETVLKCQSVEEVKAVLRTILKQKFEDLLYCQIIAETNQD